MKNATKEQIKIAKMLGINIAGNSSIIAAAKIESEVFEAIYPGEEKREATEKQKDFLVALGVAAKSNDFILVSALIDEELQKRNIAAINKLKLKSGDTIISEQYGQEKEDVISSISSNYRIWFKGGQGRGCWPSKVIKKIS